ncbi:MAG: hypothetical protein IPN86_20825, partial [Saprospiraceae bacterium]|nr:hypothetical protein [Saprospiraceae bacterium]
KWFRKSAEQGNSSGQNWLGYSNNMDMELQVTIQSGEMVSQISRAGTCRWTKEPWDYVSKWLWSAMTIQKR